MPKPYPKEFRDDVVAVARQGQGPLTQIAKDFGISETWLSNCDRVRRGPSQDLVLLLQQPYFPGRFAVFPLVREMAAASARIRVPVAVACRVLGLSTQGYYKWLRSSATRCTWRRSSP